MTRTPLEQDIDGAHIEISRIMITMFQGVYTIGAVIIAAYLLMVRNDTAELARVAGLCGVSLMFAVGLGHHTSERISGWLRYIDRYTTKVELMGWEEYKKQLRSRALVPVLDIGMATAPLYVTWKFGWLLYASDPAFAFVTLALLVAAFVLNGIGLTLADK